MPIAYLASFIKGFRIGYREPEPLPPAVTLLRAMASTAAMIGDAQLLDSILNGDVAASTMLPSTRLGDRFKPLIPARLSVVLRLSKYIARKSGLSLRRKVRPYLTLSAAIALVKALDASASARGLPTLDDVADELAKDVEVKSTRRDEVILCEKSEAVKLAGDIEVEVPKPTSEHRNTIDRSTGAARPFVVTYMSVKDMLLLVDAPAQLNGQLDRALRLLGEVGIGGLRSRGLGRFAVERAKLTPEDERALEKVVPLNKARHGRYALALGELSLSSDALDWRRSFFEAYVIAGYVGPPYAQALYGPLAIAQAGSIVKVKEGIGRPIAETVELKTRALSSMFIFNPLVVVGE